MVHVAHVLDRDGPLISCFAHKYSQVLSAEGGKTLADEL